MVLGYAQCNEVHPPQATRDYSWFPVMHRLLRFRREPGSNPGVSSFTCQPYTYRVYMSSQVRLLTSLLVSGHYSKHKDVTYKWNRPIQVYY